MCTTDKTEVPSDDGRLVVHRRSHAEERLDQIREDHHGSEVNNLLSIRKYIQIK
jgi:hypothetical protein